MSGLPKLFIRAKLILQTEGFVPLIRRGFPFVVERFFRCRTYYLSEHTVEDIRKLNEADFMPRIDDFTIRIISTNQEVDELEAEGFEFLEFRSPVASTRQRLDKGAIAFCIFVERELVSIAWVAMTQEAKDSLDEPPFRVDFAKGEVCGGNVWTNPKYRRMRLSEYNRFKRLEFMMETGGVLWRRAIPTGNIAVRIGYARIGPKIYAEARYLKILWWKSWKEKPLTNAAIPQMFSHLDT